MEEYESSPARDRNPSPPPELRENRSLDRADKVGQSAFSQQWIYRILMKLLQVAQADGEKPESIEVGEDLQNELCELWDMSMNAEVADFLYNQCKAMEVLTRVVERSDAPRVVEICVGILGNMACSKDVCTAASKYPGFVDLMVSLLDTQDSQTLVQTCRLCHTCLCNPDVAKDWLAAMRAFPNIEADIKYILRFSANRELLQKVGELVDKLLELDDELCRDWANQDMVQGLLDGVQEIGYSHSEALEVYLHIFELMSTTEQGVQTLVLEYKGVLVPLRKYLTGLCEYEIVGLEGRERCLSSALAVFNVIFASSPEVEDSFKQDEQGIRCLLKILEPLRHLIQELRKTTSKQTKSEKSSNIVTGEGDAKQQEESEHKTEAVVPASESDNGSKSTVESDTVEKADEDTGVESDVGKQKLESHTDTGDSEDLLLLYEVVQGFLADVVSSLHTAMPEEVAEHEETTVPPVLKYLDSMCSRERVRCLITSLEELSSSEDVDPVLQLSDMAQRLRLRRLYDIIDNVPAHTDSVSEADAVE